MKSQNKTGDCNPTNMSEKANTTKAPAKGGAKGTAAKAVKAANIYAALAIFQQGVPAISKEKSAGDGKWSYKYGSLPHIIEAIKPHLKTAGLVFFQPIVTVDGTEYIDTVVHHVESETSIDSRIELPQAEFKGMNIVQSKGAIITYMRRYALMSILGLVTDEDDTDAVGTVEQKSKAATGGRAGTRQADKSWLNPAKDGQPTEVWTKAVKYLADGGKIADIKKKYRISKANEEKLLNEAMTFDDLPFDRQAAEGQDGAGDGQVNMDFENQGPGGREFDGEDNPSNY